MTTGRRPINNVMNLSQSAPFREEVEAFGQAAGLTKREREIISVLALGVTRIKEIAERLAVSPNTVNNHMNSVFTKTKTRSKSEVLSRLIAHIAEDLKKERAMRSCPQVLFIGTELRQLASELNDFGFHADWVGSIDEASRALRAGHYAFFILCDEQPGLALRALRFRTKAASDLALQGQSTAQRDSSFGLIWPRAILCRSSYPIRDALGSGYWDSLPVGASSQDLARNLAFHGSNLRDARRHRGLGRWRGPVAETPLLLNQTSWGLGGFVASAKELDASLGEGFSSTLEVGDMFEASVSRDQRSWRGDIQTVWSDLASPVPVHGFRFWPADEDALAWNLSLSEPDSETLAILPRTP